MMATSKIDRSCSGDGDEVEHTMEGLPRDIDEDIDQTQKPPSVFEESVHHDEATPCGEVTVTEAVGKTLSMRRGMKRSIGEVSESETSDLDNGNKSSKVDSLPSCSNARTKQVPPTVKDKIHITDAIDENSRVRSESLNKSTLDASNSRADHDAQDDKTSNKTKPSSTSNYIKDTKSTITQNIKTLTTTNNIINSSCNSASNSITSSSKASNNTSDARSSFNNENTSKQFPHSTNSDDSSSTRNSRVCNDISNTSAASNSSDTRSMSSTMATALTIVTSSSSCSRTSSSSRDTSNTSRASSDTNNNNRDAVNNNSDDSCQSAESGRTESGRTPTLTSGRKVYGLRPRSSRRRLWAQERPTPEDESSETLSDSSAQSELNSAETKGPHGNSSKSKTRGSSKSRGTRTKPLSKYRRVTANARERERMKEINTAFAALRAALPTIADYRIASMTKYTTLQLASSYIRDLSKMLDETPSSDSENKKENCPTYLHGALTSSNRRDVNLSVGISELSFERNQQSGSEDKPGEFSVFPNAVNSISNITEEQLEGLGDIENLSDMCWALDFMLD